MEVKDIIKKRRKEKHMTMKQLAEKVQVSEGTISPKDKCTCQSSPIYARKPIFPRFSGIFFPVFTTLYHGFCPQIAPKKA